MKRREVKSKGAKERYKHLNAEFQRIARRDKKAFLSHQCKEIEENNRMGKTRDPFKKIRIPRIPRVAEALGVGVVIKIPSISSLDTVISDHPRTSWLKLQLVLHA